MYSPANIKSIQSEFALINPRFRNLSFTIGAISQNLTQTRSQEYLLHGVGRRLRIIYQCIANIFKTFPPNRNDLLGEQDRVDICINLHAFYVNMFGLFDNLAWIVVHEKLLADKINKKQIALYSKEMQKHLDAKFCTYLNSDQIKTWHDKYSKDFRDSLSHRIPLYVPPYYSEIDNTGTHSERKPAALFTHSLHEPSPSMKMHPQLLADFNTIEEILRKFCELQLKHKPPC